MSQPAHPYFALFKTPNLRSSLAVDRIGRARYNGSMAESLIRRRKKQDQNARWRKLRPTERLYRAAEITAAGTVLRAAGLARLGLSLAEIAGVERSRAV